MKRATKACVALSVFLFVLIGSLAYAQNAVPQPVQQLTVWDSKGKMVGNVLPPFYVALRIENRLVLLAPERFRLGPSNSTYETGLVYESTDCSGTAYSEAVFDDPAQMVPVSILNGQKIYVADGFSRSFLAHSSFTGSTCEISEYVATFTPVRLFVNLSNFFVPPFTLP